MASGLSMVYSGGPNSDELSRRLDRAAASNRQPWHKLRAQFAFEAFMFRALSEDNP
jgi:hypothetical protein